MKTTLMWMISTTTLLVFLGLYKLRVALMSALEKKAALPQIREFYYTYVKVSEGYYKVKVDR